jgi:serine/threonine protein kinase
MQGTTVPGYQLLQSLGGGLMTAVYTAQEIGSDTPCAIKMLREEYQDDPTAIKLLQREARAGLSVHHPHLVTITRAHVTRIPYFLVMDLLPGESLRTRLRRNYRLEISDAIWITRQTAEALHALHRRGFLHGDVKPDNLRLTSQGTAVLLDLGLAHRPGENDTLLQRGYVLGTANYLAPELCDANPRDGLHTDLFSLGITLFEMLTGRLPYPPGSLRQTFRRHHCDPPADIRRSVSNLPSTLANLVQRLLSRRPEDRPRASSVVQHLVRLEIAGFRRRSA